MTFKEIYSKFRIPPSLQEHMMRVCAVVSFLEKHWTGKHAVDWDLTKRLALLHNMGNIVKFDLDRYPGFLGSEKNDVEYWKVVQAEVIAKYGSDDHAATQKMLREIEVSEQVIALTLNKSFGKSVETAVSKNWPLKILYYADFRTLPLRFGTLEERIDDVRQRMPWYANRPDFDKLVQACKKIETQIQQAIDIPVSEINDESVLIDPSDLKLTI